MEEFIISVGLYCLLMVLALLGLKKEFYLHEKEKAANSSSGAEDRSGSDRLKDLLEAAAGMSKWCMIVVMFKNVTFFNPFCQEVPNRSLLIVLTCSATSLYLNFVDFWVPAFSFGSFLALLLLLYQLLQARRVVLTGQLLVEEQEKTIKRSQIVSCGMGILAIGICLFLLSQVYRRGNSEDLTLLFRLVIAMLVDSLAVKPILCVLVGLLWGNTPLLVFIATAQPIKTNKIRNQFYKTSESEANVNETMHNQRDNAFLQEQTEFPQLHFAKQPISTTNDDHLQFQSSTVPSQHHQQSSLAQEVELNSRGKVRKCSQPIPNTTNVRALKEKGQTSTQATIQNIEKESFFQSKSSFLVQKENQCSQRSRKRYSRPKKISEIESYRIVKIYGDNSKKQKCEKGVRNRWSQGDSFKKNGIRNSQDRRRTRPIVHETPNQIIFEKIDISSLFRPQEETH